jgi:hypothetical protein
MCKTVHLDHVRHLILQNWNVPKVVLCFRNRKKGEYIRLNQPVDPTGRFSSPSPVIVDQNSDIEML